MTDTTIEHNKRASYFQRLTTWPFWRSMIIYFCVFSVLGHLIEDIYVFNGAYFFNSVPMDIEVLTNPLKPYLVYGFGIIACAILLVPLRIWLIRRYGKILPALVVFYIASVFVAMIGELTQGFIQNQPVDGVYPLWDVSKYPGNILGQAWIVNDICYGFVISFVVWHIYPMFERHMAKLTSKQANILCVVTVILFIVLFVWTYFFW